MSKSINEEKIILLFSKIADYELPSATVQNDLEQLRGLLAELKTGRTFVKGTIWRTIMQSRYTKYISAALVFLAVMIGMQFFPESELNAAELLIKVSQTMQHCVFVKSVTKSYLPGNDEPVETRIHYSDSKNRQVFLVYGKGYIHHLDYGKMIWRVYRPEDNTMIENALKGEWAGPGTQVKDYIEKLKNEGLEVRKTDEFRDGIPFTIIEYDETLNNINHDPASYMSTMLMNGRTVKTIKTKITVNRDTLFLSQYEVRYYTPQDQLIITEKTEGEPVDWVPADVYELGVPSDVKIINKIPGEEVQKIRSLIDEQQDRFLSHYIAVQTEIDLTGGQERLMEGMVIYCKGKKIRVDEFRREYPSDKKRPICTEVTGLLKESLSRLEPFISQTARPRSIRIYDGLWQHKIEEHDGALILCTPQRRPDGDEFADDDIADFGWRKLWWLNEPEWMYEDDFSAENGLAGMELTAQSEFGRLPKRLVLYVDPAKDYLYRRYIEEELVDAPWQVDKGWLDKVENKGGLTERVRIYDVVDYGRTSEGQWYPKVFTIKGYDNYLRERPFKEDIDRICRIYLLEENPDLPEELFDPAALSFADSTDP
jgi:hypothetical protein